MLFRKNIATLIAFETILMVEIDFPVLRVQEKSQAKQGGEKKTEPEKTPPANFTFFANGREKINQYHIKNNNE